MEKKYEHPEKNGIEKQLNEPVAEYDKVEDIIISPSLTKEELNNAITGDELLDYIFEKIDQLPGE